MLGIISLIPKKIHIQYCKFLAKPPLIIPKKYQNNLKPP